MGQLRPLPGPGFPLPWTLTLASWLQVHLRHLVGGRARSFTGELPHERIIQVDFPERAGALRKLLAALDPEWNVTLFHYRKTGALGPFRRPEVHTWSRSTMHYQAGVCSMQGAVPASCFVLLCSAAVCPHAQLCSGQGCPS